MNCRRAKSLFPLRIGQDLDLRTRTAVDDHLARCLNCYREYSAFERARAAVREHRTAMHRDPANAMRDPDRFARQVLASIDGPPPLSRAPRLLALGGWVTAAAALLLFLGLRGGFGAAPGEGAGGRVSPTEAPLTPTRPLGLETSVPGPNEPGPNEPGDLASATSRDPKALLDSKGSIEGEGPRPNGSADPSSVGNEIPALGRIEPRRLKYWDF